MKPEYVWIVRVITSDGIAHVLHAFANHEDAKLWRRRALSSMDENSLSPAEILGVRSILIEPLRVFSNAFSEDYDL